MRFIWVDILVCCINITLKCKQEIFLCNLLFVNSKLFFLKICAKQTMATCSKNTLIFNKNNNQGKYGSSTHAKRIISTMESVINSVRKERRNRKKHLKSDEPEINNISSVLSNNLSLISPNLDNQQKDGIYASAVGGSHVIEFYVFFIIF